MHCLSLDPSGTRAGVIACENVSHNWRGCRETANIRLVFQLILPFQLDLPFDGARTIPARVSRDQLAASEPDKVRGERTRAASVGRGIDVAR